PQGAVVGVPQGSPRGQGTPLRCVRRPRATPAGHAGDGDRSRVRSARPRRRAGRRDARHRLGRRAGASGRTVPRGTRHRRAPGPYRGGGGGANHRAPADGLGCRPPHLRRGGAPPVRRGVRRGENGSGRDIACRGPRTDRAGATSARLTAYPLPSRWRVGIPHATGRISCDTVPTTAEEPFHRASRRRKRTSAGAAVPRTGGTTPIAGHPTSPGAPGTSRPEAGTAAQARRAATATRLFPTAPTTPTTTISATATAMGRTSRSARSGSATIHRLAALPGGDAVGSSGREWMLHRVPRTRLVRSARLAGVG